MFNFGELRNMFNFKSIAENDIRTEVEKVYAYLANHFKYDLRKDTFLAGGAIASLGRSERPRDFDFFFTSDHNLAKFKAIIRVTDQKYHETDNAISFDFPIDNDWNYYVKVQFIKVSVGNPRRVTNGFDFHHCMNFYHQGELSIRYPNSILNKELTFNTDCDNPNGAPGRYKKFTRRGYTPTKTCEKDILNNLVFGKPLIATYTD